MGLAAPRKRVKISHDPNNTKWAQSTDGFGHRIMTSQGWTPGSFLGARNASHSDTFTKASASHIRVTLKDDTLGLGARPRNPGNDNVAAIDAFQGLLGRLNGKSDTQLEEEQRRRDDTRLALYARTKWETVNFISGGYLVPEKPSDAAKSSRNNMNDTEDGTSDTEDEHVKPTLDGKDDEANQSAGSVSETMTVNKKDVDGKLGKDTKDKKKKRRKEAEAKKETKEKARKEKREKKKDKEEKGKKDKPKKRQRTDTDGDLSDSLKPNELENDAPPSKAANSKRQTPQWRQSLRGRHIQQKKLAVMDDRSLGEIFMIKA